MTHETPSITGYNCSVGKKTQSEIVGQGLRGENEHIFKRRAPQNSSENLTVSMVFGSVVKWHKESAYRMNKKEENKKKEEEEGEDRKVIGDSI